MGREIYQFAEFTFESRTGTLKRKNVDLHLPEQTARLLRVLLQRANTVVTRDELRAVLWPDEEFLDYDQGINTAINRLRNALRDDSRNPHWIRTVPKRGYILCGEIVLVPVERPETIESPAAAQSPEKASTSDGESEIDQALPVASSSRPTESQKRRLMLWAVAGPVVAILITTVVIGILHLRAERSAAHLMRLGIPPLQVRGVAAQGDVQLSESSENFRMEMADAIAKLPGVEVRAALPQMPDGPATDLDLSEATRNLDDLLLGSFVAEGSTYDLRFELVRAADTMHLASFEYSGTAQELPSICNRLQQDIFYYLQSQVSTIQTLKGSTDDSHAYDLYLQGTYSMFERSPDALHRAISEFQAAVNRDPNFAAAYAGIATAYLKLSAYDADSDSGSLRKAQEFARKAIQLNPQLAQGHAVLGYAAFTENWNFNQGESELRYAIRLDPTKADYRDWLSVLLTDEGRFNEMLQQLNLAHESDPNWPSVYAMKGLMASYAGRKTIAVAEAKQYVELLPGLPLAHNTMAWVYFKTGQYKEAIEEWKRMALLQNDPARVKLESEGMKVLASRGIAAYAQLHLDAIRTKQGTREANDFIPAEWYACAGDRDRAMAELERLTAAHDAYVLSLAVNPLFNAYHKDPEFLKLVARVGLPLPQTQPDSKPRVCEASPS
jgi:DNA-binding winged helix-turn-helix (wHTH) protein/Tfp pilus assembly protein PilF